MRKYLSLLLAALAVACAKEPQREAEVVFSIGVPSGEITRSVSEGIAAALSECVPSGPFSLTALSQTNELRSYSITTGEALTMAVDTYQVTGTGEGQFLTNITTGVAYTTPSWGVNTSVTIGEDGGEFTVPAVYNCSALVFDKAKTDKVIITNGAKEIVISSFGGNDEYGIIFVRQTTFWTIQTMPWVYVYPSDKVYGETTIYKLNSGQSSGTLTVKAGYWYLLLPGEVDIASGQFGLEFPSWKEGE